LAADGGDRSRVAHGVHNGQLSALPDGRGTTFAPNRAFAAGEQVSVRGALSSPGAGTASGAPHATEFEWQHDARMQPNGTVTLFDDAVSPREESQSRAIQLQLNAKTMKASLDHSYTHTP
jgi:hypothetical protein